MHFAIEDFSFRYPAQDHWAVREVTLEIEPGQITWLTGALGSGTSTLMLAMAGLAPRLTGGTATGRITADGNDVTTSSPLEAGIAYVGPAPALQLSGIAPTVRDEIAITPINLGRDCEAIPALVQAAIDRMALGPLADREPHALSGGETQRVLIGSMLAAAPRAWLLDEPFSALDRTSAASLQQLLRESARAGSTVIVCCDDSDIMHGIADRVIVLQSGQIAIDGMPSQILASSELLAAGAGTTDAASLAHAAGFPPPWPLDREALLRQVGASPLGPPALLADHGRLPSRLEQSPAFRVNDLDFSYDSGRPVLCGVSVAIDPGEAVGVFGANGAGKSTLLRLAMALEQPRSGAVCSLGLNTRGRHPEDLAPRVGFLYQQPDRQLFASSVRAECALAPRLAGWTESRISGSIERVLTELGLSETAEEHPYDLPLARRRLVALATILTAEPMLLLLDEPTAGLDFTSRERVIRVIREACRRGTAVLAVTHDAAFAHEALDRGMLLEAGRVGRDGPVRELIDDVTLRKPAALVVAEALDIPAGRDRRADVAAVLRQRY